MIRVLSVLLASNPRRQSIAHALMMNPVPPITCGVQNTPSNRPLFSAIDSCTCGIAVKLSRKPS
jgi:hypothetical protein